MRRGRWRCYHAGGQPATPLSPAPNLTWIGGACSGGSGELAHRHWDRTAKRRIAAAGSASELASGLASGSATALDAGLATELASELATELATESATGSVTGSAMAAAIHTRSQHRPAE